MAEPEPSYYNPPDIKPQAIGNKKKEYNDEWVRKGIHTPAPHLYCLYLKDPENPDRKMRREQAQFLRRVERVFLPAFNMKLVPAYGTLLGFQRERDIIPFDDDIDLFATETEFKRIIDYDWKQYEGKGHENQRLIKVNGKTWILTFIFEGKKPGKPEDCKQMSINEWDNHIVEWPFAEFWLHERYNEHTQLVRNSINLKADSGPNKPELQYFLPDFWQEFLREDYGDQWHSLVKIGDGHHPKHHPRLDTSWGSVYDFRTGKLIE